MRHSRLGGSGAHRYFRCAGAPNAERYWTSDTGDDAAEGTAGHHLMEACFVENKNPADYLGEEIVVWQDKKAEVGYNPSTWADFFDGDGAQVAELSNAYKTWNFRVDTKMAGYIGSVVEDVREFPGDLFAEQEVSLAAWLGDGEIGNADITVIEDNVFFEGEVQRVLVADPKYGFVQVDVKDNEQLMLYALGVWDKFKDRINDDAEFVLRIYQPRINYRGEWAVSLNDLLKFGERASVLAEATRDPKAKRTAGEVQCARCDARPRCPEYTWWVSDIMKIDIKEVEEGQPEDEISLPSMESLSVEAKARIFLSKKAITNWLSDIETSLSEDYDAGVPIPAVKKVYGRGGRDWADLPKAETFLRQRLNVDEAYKKTLITPAQAEDLLSPKVYQKMLNEGLVRQFQGKPVLVAASDNRPEIERIDDMFDDLDGDAAGSEDELDFLN